MKKSVSLPSPHMEETVEEGDQEEEELAQDMVPLQPLLAGGFQSRNVRMFLGSSARMFQREFQDRNAKMSPDKNVRMSLKKCATQYQNRSATMFQWRSVTICLVLCQEKSVRMSLHSNAEV